MAEDNQPERRPDAPKRSFFIPYWARDAQGKNEPLGPGTVAIASALTIMCIGGVAAFEAYANAAGPDKDAPHWVLTSIAAVIALIIWAIVLYRMRTSRRLILGALIGFGVAILIEGACFGIFH